MILRLCFVHIQKKKTTKKQKQEKENTFKECFE